MVLGMLRIPVTLIIISFEGMYVRTYVTSVCEGS